MTSRKQTICEFNFHGQKEDTVIFCITFLAISYSVQVGSYYSFEILKEPHKKMKNKFVVKISKSHYHS